MLLPTVGEAQAQPLVQERQFAQTGRKNVVIVFGNGENLAVGLEGHQRTAFLLGGGAGFLYRIEGLALFVFLHEMLAATENVHLQVGGKGVDARNAHTVQTARNLIGAFIELTAGVQHRHHHFQRTAFFLGVHIGGDTAAIVAYRNGIILVNGHLHMGAVARQGLVDGVVHHFIHQMVQTPHVYVADIHGGTLAHGLQSLQYLNVLGGIVGLFLLLFFYFAHNQ